jgi:hypothetical protein
LSGWRSTTIVHFSVVAKRSSTFCLLSAVRYLLSKSGSDDFAALSYRFAFLVARRTWIKQIMLFYLLSQSQDYYIAD